ncbi:Uncharacterised protein [Cronobacter sakazakii]|nr:Uncharacterised protein [Cronobacter sakazakii]
MDMERIRFEELFSSIFRSKYDLSRTAIGYLNPFVNSCFFFWQEGRGVE